MRTTKTWTLVLLLSLFCISCRADICKAAPPAIPFSDPNNVADVQLSIGPAGNIIALGLINPGSALEAVIYNAQTQTWSSPPEMLSSSTASDPIIETDSKGNAIAAWFQGNQVWASFYEAFNKTWTTSQQISSASASASPATVQIGFLGSTGGMVIWAANEGSYFVESSIFDGTAWQTCAHTIPQTQAISEVHLGTTDSGHALALWLHGSTPFASIYHPNTHCWGIPQSFTNPITTTSFFPILATSNAGPSAASWLTKAGSSYALELLPLSVPFPIDQYLSYMMDSFQNPDHFYHQSAISPNGNSFHLWQRAGGSGLIIQANSINVVSGTGSDTVEFADFSSSAINPQLQLKSDHHGNAIGAWVDPSAPTDIKQATYSAQQGTWGSPETISGNAPIQNLTLSVNGAGNYAVAWIESASALVEFDNTPAAPSNLTVYEITNRFPFQGEHSHQLNWKASTSPDVVQSKVYKENTLLTILPNSTTTFRVHNCPADTVATYFVYSVSAQGIVSLAASVTFNPQD